MRISASDLRPKSLHFDDVVGALGISNFCRVKCENGASYLGRLGKSSDNRPWSVSHNRWCSFEYSELSENLQTFFALLRKVHFIYDVPHQRRSSSVRIAAVLGTDLFVQEIAEAK